MRLTRKVAGMMVLGGASRHAGRKPPGKAERARAKAEKAQRHADISELAEKEAEAIPGWPPDPSRGHGEQPRSPKELTAMEHSDTTGAPLSSSVAAGTMVSYSFFLPGTEPGSL